jgi:hypothetical protein
MSRCVPPPEVPLERVNSYTKTPAITMIITTTTAIIMVFVLFVLFSSLKFPWIN